MTGIFLGILTHLIHKECIQQVIRMEWCGLCNGIMELTISCPECGTKMDDEGRVYDYYDDYSPYMEIEWMKLVDGDPKSSQKRECQHLYKCNHCGHSLSKEVDYASYL
jgi:hypothetical protein